MKRVKTILPLGLGVLAVGLGAVYVQARTLELGSPQEKVKQDPRSPKRPDKVLLTDAEWKKKLTPAQYKILRWKGTEPAFCGIFHDNKKAGTYYCAGCELPLFSSNTKFDSGTGWPSFFQPVSRENVWSKPDFSAGMVREEVLCARCDGHLGHVFRDAPRTPTGLRFCINSDALTFKDLATEKAELEAKAKDQNKG